MNMDGGSNLGSYVVTGLAIVGIALSGSALYVGLNGRAGNTQQADRISEIEQNVERLRGADEELQGLIRGLYSQTRTSLEGMAAKIDNLAAKPVVAPPPPPPANAAPAMTTTATEAPSGKTYTVRAGDFPAKIAKANSITVNALMKANPNLNPNKLKVGQVLQLP